MTGAPTQRERDYPPPWGGRGVYPDLCLHMLSILRRPADLGDLRRLPGLSHALTGDLLTALEHLEAAGRVCRSIAPTHYRIGSQAACRDVMVWTLPEGGAP
jgi:hypothetical protein